MKIGLRGLRLGMAAAMMSALSISAASAQDALVVMGHKVHQDSITVGPGGDVSADWRVLRHTFASIAASLGFSELTISGLLGHGPRGVTQRYVHLDAALMIAADQVAAEIARLLEGGEVLSMKEAKRLRYSQDVRAAMFRCV